MTPQPTSELLAFAQKSMDRLETYCLGRDVPDVVRLDIGVLIGCVSKMLPVTPAPAPDTIQTTVTWHRGGGEWPFDKLKSPLVKYRTTAGVVTTGHIYDHMWDKIVSWCYDADLVPPTFEERRDDASTM